MPDLERLLAGQSWIDSFRHLPAQGNSSASISIVLGSRGFDLVQSRGISALLSKCSELLACLANAEPALHIQFARPTQLDDLKLPTTPEYAALRYWRRETALQAFLIEVDADWDLFSGHFPGLPILPGIIQVHWAAQFAHHFLGRIEIPTEVRQLKFRNIFVPPGWLVLELQTLSKSELRFQVASIDGVHAQGKLLYAE